MTKVVGRRTISASQQRVWEVLDDPHHLPRWWPGIQRVEDVREDRWTDVFVTKRGRPVRADFHLLVSERPWRRCWEQELLGTPFERVLAESITDVTLASAGNGTLVTIAQHQKLRGYSRTGGLLVRRAGARKLDEALEGLERVCRASGS
jgi:carbon monoxide dehydrogenase subunit G